MKEKDFSQQISTERIQESEEIGRKVDVRTPAELRRFFRKEVDSKARVAYAG